MSKRTAIVVSPYSHEYGPARILQYAAESLVSLGVTPVCIVPAGARLTSELRGLSPETHTVAELSTVPRTLNPAHLAYFMSRHIRAAREIETIARTHNASLVYSTSEAILCSGMAARALRVPSVVHVIGMSIGSPRWTGEVYVRALASLTDRFIACSSQVAEMLAACGVDDERIAVVHHGIPVAEIAATAMQGPDLGQGLRVGMVGAYDPRKGQELFVTAADLVRRRFPNVRFYLIGSTIEGNRESEEYHLHVRRLIDQLGLTSHFTLTGYLPDQDDVYRWMGAMDVIVVPSKTEAFSLVLLESMACGKPVVATRIEGNLDAFVHGYSGLYATPSPEDISDAVCSILSNPELGDRMGRNAAEHARLLFDIPQTLDATQYVLDEALRGHALFNGEGGLGA